MLNICGDTYSLLPPSWFVNVPLGGLAENFRGRQWLCPSCPGARRSCLLARLCWTHPHHSPQRASLLVVSQPPPRGAKLIQKPCSLWGGPLATAPTVTGSLRVAPHLSPSAGSRTHLPTCRSCFCTWKRVSCSKIPRPGKATFSFVPRLPKWVLSMCCSWDLTQVL